MPPDPRSAILDAALVNVPFDGWSEATLKAAARDAGVPLAEARALFPRGPVDLALAWHIRGDDAMADRLRQMDLADMRFRDRVAAALRTRIEVVRDKEAVRRGFTLFSLPMYSADGSKALWGTADRIWTALGDTATDINWYTKRATLAGVYGSTVLYWLGDDSLDNQDTWAFIDRRIEDVMRIEKVKAAANANPILRTLLAGPNWALGHVRAPMKMPRVDLPGTWRSTPE
ncbi:rpsU-divergently transcribed protein [Oceaniovalibus guishaninsula JLT2003]|uniref:RpsU-divergently transcribed protein n=1 Tax=Oceaniovalibus guishaninsula JLT2003 TaxID=1231392 RepID=K2H9X6_9RHOB|nr:COQ9 family protein [Oceaniovalibus guishaninsula]EKE44348.1 rpsU-divergently transcribed protein [Oceaniovalibus guishaninsula JLT2003]